jgi:threonine aldolase
LTPANDNQHPRSWKSAIDLRSDAVTQPTEAMWEAMRAARPHWSAGGGDPSVLALEVRAAELTGKPAALFVPTGTIANLLALMSQLERGDQVILESSSHILWSEEWALSYICGALPRPINGIGGMLDPEEVAAAIAERRFAHRPRTRLICLENTHNASGGAVLRPEQTRQVAAVAREHGVALHLDGARLCNAQVALGVSLRDLTAEVDTVALGLSKGLGAPGGALLCGPQAFVERSRVNLKRLGAHSLPNAGIQAAAGLVALDTMIPRLAEDHRRARMLAEGLADLPRVQLAAQAVRTNIVMAAIDGAGAPAVHLAEQLARRGILAITYSDTVIRFVTHCHIADEDIERAVDAVSDILA